MKQKILTVALCGCLALGLATTSLAATFTDMPDNYATDALEAAVENGLFSGTDAGLIQPTANLTRAEMATIMVRALGGFIEADISAFTDVSPTAWYSSSMATAVYMEIFKGDGTNLNPTNAITRQEVAVVLANAFHLSAEDTSVLDNFNDSSEISAWAEGSVAAMVEAGFIYGDDVGNFNPTDSIKRQDFAVIMNNMISTYITESGAYTTQLDGSVIINTPDVTLSNMTIAGDLIIGDGVGDGDITLNDVIVEGHTIIRGGGRNSIVVTGDSSLGTTTIAKIGGDVRLAMEGNAVADSVHVTENTTEVYIEGAVTSLSVDSSSVVTFTQGVSNDITLVGEEAVVILAAGSEVASATINSDATGASIVVADGGTVSTVSVAATSATVSVESNATVSSVVATESASAFTTTVADGASVEQVSVEASDAVVTVESGASVSTIAVQETASNATVIVASDAAVSSVATAAASTVVVNDGAVDNVSFAETATGSSYVVGENASTSTTVTAESVESVTVTTTEAYEATIAAAEAEAALQEAVDAGASDEDIAALESAASQAATEAETATESAQDTVTNVTDNVVQDTVVVPETPSTSTDTSTDTDSTGDSTDDTAGDSTGGSTSGGSSTTSSRDYYVTASLSVEALTSYSAILQTEIYTVSSSGSGDKSISEIVTALGEGENITLMDNLLTTAGLGDTLTTTDVTTLANNSVARWLNRLSEGETAAEAIASLQNDLNPYNIETTFSDNAATVLSDADGILYGYDGTVLMTINTTVAELIDYSNVVLNGSLADALGDLGSYECTLIVTIVRS